MNKTKMAKSKNIEGEPKRLYLSDKNRVIGGVCGGIGEYFGMDPVLIRLLWFILIFAFGTGILAYLIAWIIIPRRK